MGSNETQHVHPDFAQPADAVLIAANGTEFHVQSADLARASGWFRTRVRTVAQDEKPTAGWSSTVTVSEDALTLEILLKLACGMPPWLSRLANLSDLERVLCAAEKYKMHGAAEILLLLLRQPAMQEDALHFYAVADRYYQTDLAAGAQQRLVCMPLDFTGIAHVESRQLAHIVLMRERRVRRFCAELQRQDVSAVFSAEYSPRCPHEPPPQTVPRQHDSKPCQHTSKSDTTLLRWIALVSALQCAFIAHPSVGALEDNMHVKVAIQSLTAIMCSFDTCRRPQYDWADIRMRLSRLMDGPSASKMSSRRLLRASTAGETRENLQ